MIAALIVLLLISVHSFGTCFNFSASKTADVDTAAKLDHVQTSDHVLYQSHNKFTIQSVIAQRDREKAEHPQWWRAYFAELLAACILLVGAVTFFFWWRHTQKNYGPISIPVDEEGRPYQYTRHGRIRSRSIATLNSTGVTDVQIVPGQRRHSSATFPKCSKPACVCAQPVSGGGGNKGRGKKKWNQKKEEIEVYAPSVKE